MIFFHLCCYGFSQGRKSLYNTAVYVIIYIIFSWSDDRLFLSMLGHGRRSTDEGAVLNMYWQKMPEFTQINSNVTKIIVIFSCRSLVFRVLLRNVKCFTPFASHIVNGVCFPNALMLNTHSEGTNSPCQHVELSLENMHTDVRVKRVKKRASSLHATITTIKKLSNKHGNTDEIL